MIHLNMKNFLLSAILAFAPVFAIADEVTEVVNDVAAKLVQQLPMDKKIALKSLSPDETGLPENFLRQLVSGTEAALMTSSDFEIKIINRTTTEQIWEDAIEFGDADFDKLYEASKAEILLLLDAQAAASGLTFSLTAYSLDSDANGELLASSGLINVDIDLEKALGINVKTINTEIAEIIEKIQQISATGGLIAEPSDFSEYFHNARIYQERGQNELALANYQEAILLQDLFYDPLYEYLELIVAKYGLVGAEKFFINQISTELTEQQITFAKVYFSQEVTEFFPRSGAERWDKKLQRSVFDNLAAEPYFDYFIPPTYALFLRKFGDTLQSVMQIDDFGDFSAYPNDIADAASTSARYLLMRAGNEVLNSYQSGELGDYFIDDLKGSIFANVDKIKQLLEATRIAMLFPKTFDHYYGTSGYVFSDKNMSLEFPRTFSFDPGAKNWLQNFSETDAWLMAHWGLPCGYNPNKPLPEYPDVQIKTQIIGFSREITMPFESHSGSILPIYADKCIDQMLRAKSLKLDIGNSWDAPIGRYTQQKRTVRLAAYNIGIFDDVDTSKPILLHVYFPPEGEGDPHYTVDIRTDGTQLTYGIEWWQTPEDRAYLKVGYPAVLTAQNIIQSSINYSLRDHVPRFVSYYDARGEFQKIKIQGANWFIGHELQPYGEVDPGVLYTFTKSNLERSVAKPLTCAINTKTARVVNVENYTNLRQQAGLNDRVIGAVNLGEQVIVLTPGRYLRYDRCAAACEGANQNAIKTCVDNNDVWIEVQHNGRRGFLSRKFLE